MSLQETLGSASHPISHRRLCPPDLRKSRGTDPWYPSPRACQPCFSIPPTSDHRADDGSRGSVHGLRSSDGRCCE
eukprot:30751-Eustigmatos_ZCMA.PRE.1